MNRVVVLQGQRGQHWSARLRDAELVRDADALVRRIRDSPGETTWVAIPPDVEDPAGLAAKIRQADAGVGVVLLGTGGEPSGALRDSLEVTGGSDSESALAASCRERDSIRSLLHGVDAVILVVKLDGTVCEWNHRAESLYGVSRKAALGRSYADALPNEERDRIGTELRRLAEGGAPSESIEHCVRSPLGTRHLLWNAAPVADEFGDPAVLFTGGDVTEFRRAEQELRETQRRSLEAEKLASITALTAGIAHDIGTPMTAVLGYAELIAKSVGDDKNRKRAATIVEQVHRVSDLIEKLMNLSRSKERPARSLELAGILDKALDLYREEFERRAIEVERDYARAPQVLGDPDRLHQVLLALLLDTVHAMPEGGTLRVSLGETRSGDAELRVSDTGTGIDPELRARNIAPYFSAKQRPSATLLGLLVAKTIVEEHGGRIALTSDAERGTEFRLTFPALPAKAHD